MSATGYRRFKYSEEDLENSLIEIRTKTSTLCGASIKYGVPKATLHNKILDKVSGSRKMSPQTVLSAEEESKVEKWIIDKAKVGFPMHPEMVKDAVKGILKENGRENPFVDNRPGKKWMSLYLKRNPEIVKRNTEIIFQARAAVTEEKIRAWFAEVIEFMKKEGSVDVLKDDNGIFNCDEISMHTCPKTGIVFGPKGFKIFHEIANEPEKESITVLCTYFVVGKVPPLMVVFLYKRIPNHIADRLPNGWAIGCSDSGWMVSSPFYEYVVNAFHSWLVENNIELPVILFLDGHKSHSSLELYTFCIKKGIIVYCLLPNSTHIMQPCDVSMFRTFKVSWKRIVRSRKHESGKAITRTNFVTLFKTAFDESAKKVTVENGFRACGLFPFYADAVDHTRCVSERHKCIRNKVSKESPTSDEYAITKRVIEHTLGPVVTDTLMRTYHGCDDCDDSLFKVWKLCMERSGGLELFNVNEEIPSSQESDVNVNDTTDQIREIGTLHSLNGLSELDEIPIDFIGSDVDFSLADIAKELQIPDVSNLADYKTDQVLTTSTEIIDTTISESENPGTRETELPASVSANKPSHTIDAVEVEKATVKEPESENSETNETDLLPTVLADQMPKNKPTILSSVIIRLAFNTSSVDTDKIWNKHLHWPKLGDKSLKKGQKTGMTAQVPFAITFNEWREIQEKKQNELLEKQEITAKEVALGEEKKEQKEEEKARKNNQIKNEPQEKNDTCLKRKDKVVKKVKDVDENHNTTVKDIVIDLPVARTRWVKNKLDEQFSTVPEKGNAEPPAKKGIKRKQHVKTTVKKKSKD